MNSEEHGDSLAIPVSKHITHIDGPTYMVDIEWDRKEKPVLYAVMRGKLTLPKDAFSISATVIQIINASLFESVCIAYDTLGLAYLPMLPKFINAGNYPSSPKTSHIIICTNNQALRLIGSVIAAVGSHKLRTFETCETLDGMQQAVKRWLNLQERARIYTVPDA